MESPLTPPIRLTSLPSPEYNPPHLTKYYPKQPPDQWEKRSVSPDEVVNLIVQALSIYNNPVTFTFAENLKERIVTFNLQGNDDRPFNYHLKMAVGTFPTLILPKIESELTEQLRIDKHYDPGCFTPKFVCTRPHPA